jgi:hypothetical protein
MEKLGMRRQSVGVADHVGRDGKTVEYVVYELNVDVLSRSSQRTDTQHR